MDASDLAIDCRAVTKRYGEILALHEVSFVAKYGSVTGLLGPNGAGKTTLIRVLTTILPPSSGEFSVAGEPHSDPSGIRSAVGVLAESGGYPKRKRAIDHLTYHGRLYGIPRNEAETRSAELLRLVGLGSRASHHIGSFSRGMRQRLGIARAMINDPRVLFLDEPTLGLDPSGQSEILQLIQHLAHDRHVAVVLTSHLLDEIERSCDQIVILDHGRIVLDRPVREALSSRSGPDQKMRISAEPATEAAAVMARLGLGYRVEPSGELVARLTTGITSAQVLAALTTAGIEVLRFDTGRRSLAEAFEESTRS